MNRTIAQPERLLIAQLQGKIRQFETAGRNDDSTTVSSGSADVDAMLPGGGYNRGTVATWLSGPGCGAEYLSLLAAKNAAREGGAIVVVDHLGQFFPPAARAMGINLGNLIVLKGSPQHCEPGINGNSAGAILPDKTIGRDEDFLWAIDQSLRCPAVAAVWGRLPDFQTSLLAERWSRRFQLSAEASGCLGLFLVQAGQSVTALPKTSGSVASAACNRADARSSGHAIWSEVQWHLKPQRSTHENTRIVRALLARCRGGVTGRAIDLEINLVTGNVRRARSEHATSSQHKSIRASRPLSLARQLAHSKAGRRAARA